jgi:outer membrane autotransporter protein
LIGSYNHYHAERVINFPGVHRTAHNGHGGYELSASLGTGLFFYPSKYQVQPYARADYIFLHQGAFREHGAQSLDLNIDATDSHYIRTDLGCRVLRCFNGRFVKYVPYLKASWVWEQQLDHARFRSSFAGTSCSFTSEGLHPVRNLFAPSIGMTVLAYDGKLSFAVHDDVEVSSQSWENRAYFNFSYRY